MVGDLWVFCDLVLLVGFYECVRCYWDEGVVWEFVVFYDQCVFFIGGCYLGFWVFFIWFGG